MNDDSIFYRLNPLLAQKQSFAICLPATMSIDGVASALSIYFALIKLGKTVSISSTGNPPIQSGLVGIEKIGNIMVNGGNDLVISFPYKDGSVNQVTYNIENDRFNIIVQAQETGEKLDPKKVKYNYTGGKVDVIFVIDAPTLQSLGGLYEKNKDKFSGVDIVNIDRHFTNNSFGSINIVDKKVSSLSELTVKLLNSIQAQIDKDIATNLYNGIASATNNFTAYSTTPSTFETIAFLMKSGAVKKQQLQQPRMGGMPPIGQGYGFAPRNYGQQAPYPTQKSFGNIDQFGTAPAPSPQRSVPLNQPIQPLQQQPQKQVKPVSFQPTPQPTFQPAPQQIIPEFEEEQFEADQAYSEIDAMQATPIEGVERAPGEGKQPPSDWLKPKIFKGSNLV